MQRVAKFDVSSRFAGPLERVAAQAAFGALCAAAMIAAHIVMGERLPEASPFALVYPSVVVATLYGHWRGGVVASLLTFVYAWYFVLPMPGSFHFADEAGPARIALSAASAAIVLVFAETFRHFVLTAMEERDDEIARRAILMQELEHRTKNNFALVLSLLEMQRRRASDPRVRRELGLAASRVHSFARAYANLAERQGASESVEMLPYLRDVVTHFSNGAFHEGIEVGFKADECRLKREVAVAIGLFTNEALTNCAKYAFPGGRNGRVDVRLTCGGERWELSVADNGVGEVERHGSAGCGLGTTLFQAFAQQARACYKLEASSRGRCVRLVSK